MSWTTLNDHGCEAVTPDAIDHDDFASFMRLATVPSYRVIKQQAPHFEPCTAILEDTSCLKTSQRRIHSAPAASNDSKALTASSEVATSYTSDSRSGSLGSLAVTQTPASTLSTSHSSPIRPPRSPVDLEDHIWLPKPPQIFINDLPLLHDHLEFIQGYPPLSSVCYVPQKHEGVRVQQELNELNLHPARQHPSLPSARSLDSERAARESLAFWINNSCLFSSLPSQPPSQPSPHPSPQPASQPATQLPSTASRPLPTLPDWHIRLLPLLPPAELNPLTLSALLDLAPHIILHRLITFYGPYCMHTAQPTLAAIAQSIIAEHGDTIQATDWSGVLKAWQAEVESRQTLRKRMQRLFGHRASGQDDRARATGKRTLTMMKEAAKHLKVDIELLASAAQGLGLAMSGIPGSSRPISVLTPRYLANEKDLCRLALLSVKDMYFLNTPVDKPLQAERIVTNREGRRCRILGTCYEELERQGVRLELKKGIVRCTQQWFEKVEERICGGVTYRVKKDLVGGDTGQSS